MQVLERHDNFLMQARNQNQNSNGIRRSEYFRAMKALAQSARTRYPNECLKLDLLSIKRIYKAEGIQLDNRDITSTRIRAAYFCDEVDCSVMVKKSLPKEPKIFSLVHELKHHLKDRDEILNCELVCGDYNENELVEVGAEVFAAEFIYPEAEMLADCEKFGINAGNCNKEDVVRFKKGCNRPVSYTFLEKRFEFFNFVGKGAFKNVQFLKLEESMFPPIYKQKWFIDRRKARANTRYGK